MIFYETDTDDNDRAFDLMNEGSITDLSWPEQQAQQRRRDERRAAAAAAEAAWGRKPF
jgi:hypothetical protein